MRYCDKWIGVLVLILALILLLYGCFQGYNAGYKKGQIDAMKGKILYKQVQETKWIRKRLR